MKIGRIVLVDPTAPGGAVDRQGPEIEKLIASYFVEPSQFVTVLVPPDREKLRGAIARLCDDEQCPLVLTEGGTGLGINDFVADVTLQVVDRPLPGFGEIMRTYSFERFKVSILSRAEAGVRGHSIIINFPARPKPIRFCLRLLREGIAEGIFQVTGTRPTLRGDEIVLPLEKFFPFLKHLRIKPDPRGEHPTLT